MSGSHQWTVPVQICSELFLFLYTCFIIVKVILVILMISSIWYCVFVKKSQIKFFLKYDLGLVMTSSQTVGK